MGSMLKLLYVIGDLVGNNNNSNANCIYNLTMKSNNSSRDEIHEKNSTIQLDGLQNKCTNPKGAKNNTNFGQNTGIQEKLDTACK